MRKMLVIAAREYNAAVRTKAFVIGLLLMPIMMGGSIVLQALLKDVRDVSEKHFAVVDRTGQLYDAIRKRVEEYNTREVFDPETGKQVRPRFVLTREEPSAPEPGAVDEQRLALSDRAQKGELFGFLDIGAGALQVGRAPSPDEGREGSPRAPASVRYQSNHPTFTDFSDMASRVVTGEVQKRRAKELAGRELSRHQLAWLTSPVPLESKGLTKRGAEGKAEDVEQNRLAAFAVPFVLLMLMFMVIMMAATPLMQGVVEEKMQRISEVLLGSVTPFQMMMGKLIGMAAVSFTIVAVYLGGAYWAAHRYNFAEYAPPALLVWFLLFQFLAALMFGSLFTAIGAACSDMKETQNLMWPVMLIACLPFFVMGSVLREPNGPVAVGLSFFPFATPMLMVARQAIPPGVPPWQPVVGITLVLATTVFCVWVAGRIFRVGILMQGKGANLAQLARWVVRG